MTYGAALTALGDPTRRAVLELVAERPRAVGEIAAHLPVSRPAVSQHLKVLKDAHLVREQHRGTRRIYEVDPAGIEAVRSWFDQFWGDALARFTLAVDDVDGEHASPAERTRHDPHTHHTRHTDRTEQP